jgi:hypothetical protein
MKKESKKIRFQDQQQLVYSNKEALFEGENNLVNYNQSIIKKFGNFFGLSKQLNHSFDSNGTMVDFGAGLGNLSQLFLNKYGIKPICIEVDPELQKVLSDKGFSVASQLSEVEGQITNLFTSNVLEHINDDLAILKEIYLNMARNGRLAIYVPALNFIYSELDTKAGHFRRYGRQELIKKVLASGFEVEKCFYNDSLGVIASLALKVFGYRNKVGLGDGRSLIVYDRFVYPMSQFFDALGMRYVSGKNLYLFAVKK